jgi:hypothetical protein
MHYIVETVNTALRGLGGKARHSETGWVESSILYILYSWNYKYSDKGAK